MPLTSTSVTTPTLLLILDGWGHRDDPAFNAISMARTPVWDKLWQQCPHTLLQTSGLKVGLPPGQMGNSEVGHMNLGAGRVVYQNLTRINKAIEDGSFFENPALTRAVDNVANSGKALHIIGLLSPGGIHSHEQQIAALIDLALSRDCRKIYLHALLDGRDTPPRSARDSLARFSDKLHSAACGQIASIAGRFFGMDRDQRWDRVRKSFDVICRGKADFQYDNAEDALDAAYARGENDEFVQASAILNAEGKTLAMASGDAVVFMNFRADRARELTHAFVDTDFDGFDRGLLPTLATFVTLTQYADTIKAPCAFPPDELNNVLGEYLAGLGKTQLRIAETEKYAHVTFFFSGGREQVFPGESRILVPSPKVSTYDLKPEMSAVEVTDKLVAAIRACAYDVIICNFANGDMVGHTGVLAAAIQAVEVLDECLGRIDAAIMEVGGDCLITADHGNVEQMMDAESGQVLTSHTSGPVPLVYLGNQNLSLENGGALADVAPSLLAIMGLPLPSEMTGHSLVHFN
ncbi:MAG: 2,3-bisphosphoglycerate-independent phosphoglycerate mutase [Pseudomonadales bacterium]|nr:2,3-bisphosphoglycerate-independent phosphoglycerate mutase [Pseudomonadales bacterium]